MPGKPTMRSASAFPDAATKDQVLRPHLSRVTSSLRSLNSCLQQPPCSSLLPLSPTVLLRG